MNNAKILLLVLTSLFGCEILTSCVSFNHIESSYLRKDQAGTTQKSNLNYRSNSKETSQEKEAVESIKKK